MTDNEIIECFQKGCALIDNDNVDIEDISGVRHALLHCAEEMLPFIHKYYTGNMCSICWNNKTEEKIRNKDKIKCKYWKVCGNTLKRKYFERDKNVGEINFGD